jgi:hypothetical protein
LVAYSCENIVVEADVGIQSAPPVPPRPTSEEELYALPRSFSCGILASRLQMLNHDSIYYGDENISKNDDEGIVYLYQNLVMWWFFIYDISVEHRSEHHKGLIPPSVPPPLYKGASTSLPCSPSYSSSANPSSAPFLAPSGHSFSHMPAERKQTGVPVEKKEKKLPGQLQKVISPRVLVKMKHDKVPEITTGPPTMPRPIKTLPPNEQGLFK